MKKPTNNESHQNVLLVTARCALLEFLYESLSQQSRKSVKALLEHNRIMINDKIVSRFDYELESGMEVIILKKNPVCDVKLRKMELVYEDESFIIINKACGLLSVSAAKENQDTAFNILHSYVTRFNRKAELYVVHRLDRDTSGIMVFSKSKDFQQQLQDNWDEAVTKRIYYAVVEGKVVKDEDEIVSWLKENAALKVYSSNVSGDGQKAITRYKVLKRNQQYSLLEVELETGRKNQIRVHLQDIGHSVVGDKKYGAKTDPLRRLGLHAAILEFTHPSTGECMHFETPVPAEFKKLFV